VRSGVFGAAGFNKSGNDGILSTWAKLNTHLANPIKCS
jgi:hypothetical protein